MLLRHATPAGNRQSIRRSGILTSFSQGRAAVVWLHSPGKTAWAVAHVAQRHKTKRSRVLVFQVTIPRTWLRRRRRGLWHSLRDIPSGRVRLLRG